MIKSTPYRYFTILMAFVVLLSSTGFGLVEHSCMMRGKSVELSALKKTETGCKACKPVVASGVRISSSLPVFKKKACCEENHRYQKIEVVSASSSFSKIFKSLPLGAALGEHTGSLPYFLCHLERSRRASSFPNTFSSKFYGRTMLSFVQSFLI